MGRKAPKPRPVSRCFLATEREREKIREMVRPAHDEIALLRTLLPPVRFPSSIQQNMAERRLTI